MHARLRAQCATFVAMCLVSLVTSRPVAADTINVMWDPNPEQVMGYALYVGAQPGTYTQRYDVGGSTSFAYVNATAGQQYCFAVSAYADLTLEGPKSSAVCGFSNARPSLANPGDQTSIVGQSAALQLVGSDPDGQALTYSATGLPSGLTVMASTGFISGTGTTAGAFAVTARASDGLLSGSQSFTWTMTAAPVTDTTAPTVSISGPTTGATYATASSSLALSGTGVDNTGVTQVIWANDRGGAGAASGTTSWSVASVALQSGTNLITVQARDAAGNQGSDVLTVTYTPPTATTAVTLVGQPSSTRNWNRVKLSWTASSWSAIEVYRNGSRVNTTANDGTYTDSIRTAAGTYDYRVCAPGAAACSNTITIYF